MSAAALPANANICRNCALAPGAFCPSCGQETDTRLPTVRQFMHDATGRLIALDGRLWRTLFALIFKPGFLTREYFDGRRRRYVRPTRLFLVTSLILFGVLRLTTGTIPFDERTIVVDEPDKASRPTTATRSEGVPANRGTASTGRAPSVDVSNGEEFGVTIDKDMNFVVKGSVPGGGRRDTGAVGLAELAARGVGRVLRSAGQTHDLPRFALGRRAARVVRPGHLRHPVRLRDTSPHLRGDPVAMTERSDGASMRRPTTGGRHAVPIWFSGSTESARPGRTRCRP
jgi:hypothetical protein